MKIWQRGIFYKFKIQFNKKHSTFASWLSLTISKSTPLASKREDKNLKG